MARRKLNGGKPTNFEREYIKAQENIRRIRHEIANNDDNTEYIIADYLNEIMPVLPDMQQEFSSASKLYGDSSALFATRGDYERAYRYVQRINRAAETEWVGEGAYPISGVKTSLSSIVEEGTTEFMRREALIASKLHNQRVRERLEAQGINMVKKTVYKLDYESGEVHTVYDKNRHPVQMWVPETPEQERKYYYSLQRDKSLQMDNPVVDFEDAVISQWGDVVPVTRTTLKSNKSKYNPKNIAKSITQDVHEYDRGDMYLLNMKAIIDTVLPQEVAEQYDEVFDDIMDLDADDRMDIVDHFIDSDGINDLDLWYLENASSVAAKLRQINEDIRESIEDVLDEDDYEILAYDGIEAITDILEAHGYDDSHSVYEQYQQMKEAGKAKSVNLEEYKSLKSRPKMKKKTGKGRKKGKK